MKLLIVESPAKTKTISKFLGKDFRIMSTKGHVKDLPKNRLGVSINGGIELEYVIVDDKEKVVADICKAASQAEEVYLAPDPDREGEIIAWHIGTELEKVFGSKKSKNKIYRITFNEISKSAVLEAIESRGEIDLKKVAAQQARRVLDRWVGYEVSPLLWSKIARGLSAGRVQSVALKIVCTRERAIQDFRPEDYWTIHGDFDIENAKLLTDLVKISSKNPDIKSEVEAKKILTDLKKQNYAVSEVKDSKKQRKAPAPFITSTLQQEAYNRLGFPVKKTMQIAQKLYEGLPINGDKSPVALITYMRTDSVRVSGEAINKIRKLISNTFGDKYLPTKPNLHIRKGGKTQDAHEAIRPIDPARKPETLQGHLDKDSLRLYELIWKRSVASQMKAAEFAQRTVKIKGGKYLFGTTGTTLLFDGFTKLYSAEGKEGDKALIIPDSIKKDLPAALLKAEDKKHTTQPPPRYSQATLIKELEKEGIGRPSTYAKILSTIMARSYTTLDEKKRFIPTELGLTVSDVLEKNFPKIVDLKFTAKMEEELDKIAAGEEKRDTVLIQFYDDFSKYLENFKQNSGPKQVIETGLRCPNCKDGKLVLRRGKNGEFVGCSNFPECTFTSNFRRTTEGKIELVEATPPEKLDKACPKCSSPLRKMAGKYGEFISCSAFPKCKYTENITASFKCPVCDASVIKRAWKGRTFWGCSNYPTCKFTAPGNIEEKKCPKCKNPYMLKQTAVGECILKCPVPKCGHLEKCDPDGTANKVGMA